LTFQPLLLFPVQLTVLPLSSFQTFDPLSLLEMLHMVSTSIKHAFASLFSHQYEFISSATGFLSILVSSCQ
jgi:hypothetical protein